MLALSEVKLTKFVSNVPSIVSEVDLNSDTRTTEEKENPAAEKFSHVLGLKWNHSTYTLVVSRGTSRNTDRNVTQRVVLSLLSAVYDPIGPVAPFTIKARLLLKNIWNLNGQRWETTCQTKLYQNSTSNGVTKSRSYFCQTVETIELQVFGDSSQEAFSAVAFLREKLKKRSRCCDAGSFRLWKSESCPYEGTDCSKVGTTSRTTCSTASRRVLCLQSLTMLLCGATVQLCFSC